MSTMYEVCNLRGTSHSTADLDFAARFCAELGKHSYAWVECRGKRIGLASGTAGLMMPGFSREGLPLYSAEQDGRELIVSVDLDEVVNKALNVGREGGNWVAVKKSGTQVGFATETDLYMAGYHFDGMPV